MAPKTNSQQEAKVDDQELKQSIVNDHLNSAEQEVKISGLSQSGKPGLLQGLMHRVAVWLSKVDTQAIEQRIRDLRQEFPAATDQELIDTLIKRKSDYTAKVGALTAATGSIPVLGTLFSLTAGMIVDLGAVLTAQAELVLEIAEVLKVPLSKDQKRETVFWVLGLGAGIEHLTTLASQRLLRKLAQSYSRRWLSHALPFVGIATAAGLNAFSTRLIGRRAQAYFTKGPQAVRKWSLSDWKSFLGKHPDKSDN